MDDTTAFRCPQCRQVTSFRPEVLAQLFGAEPIGQLFLTYPVSCKHCRKQFLLALETPPVPNDKVPAGPRGPQQEDQS